MNTAKADGDLVVSELLDRFGIAVVQLRDLLRALLFPLQLEILIGRVYLVCMLLNLMSMFLEFLLIRVPCRFLPSVSHQ